MPARWRRSAPRRRHKYRRACKKQKNNQREEIKKLLHKSIHHLFIGRLYRIRSDLCTTANCRLSAFGGRISAGLARICMNLPSVAADDTGRMIRVIIVGACGVTASVTQWHFPTPLQCRRPSLPMVYVQATWPESGQGERRCCAMGCNLAQ